MKNYKNPFSERWANQIGADCRGVEKKMIVWEADMSEAEPVYTCSECGGKCYHRPAVGGWWCIDCKHLEVK